MVVRNTGTLAEQGVGEKSEGSETVEEMVEMKQERQEQGHK